MPAARAGLAACDTPVPIGAVSMHAAAARPTGVPELDRVLDGGLVPGSVTLLAGEPGMGKSTLLLQALGSMAELGARCLLVTAEESQRAGADAGRAARRARGQPARRLRDLAAARASRTSNRCGPTCWRSTRSRPSSIPTFPVRRVRSPRYATARTGSCSRRRNASWPRCSSATSRKKAPSPGRRVLEHVVDTVLSFDGDRGHALRMLHALKHRFGSTSELGLFEMTGHGLDDVPDASSRFLLDRRAGAPGSAVAVVLEGTRPLLVEVQALVVPDCLPPRRSAAGIDPARLAMVLAVLDQHGGVSTAKAEVYASVAGGLRVTETGRRPRARARGRERAGASNRSSGARSRSARSASAVRSVRCRNSTGASTKRRVSASRTRSHRRRRHRAPVCRSSRYTTSPKRWHARPRVAFCACRRSRGRKQ